MPHLTYRKRYWRVAGDEFSLPALCSILSRVFWTILVSLVFAISIESITQCQEGWIFILYLSISILLFLSSIVCDAKLGLISLRGSITEVEQRNGLVFYLNVKMILGLIQFIVAIFGLLIVSGTSTLPCNQDFDSLIINRVFVGIVAFSQLVDVFTILFCCYCFMANKVDDDSMDSDSTAALESGKRSRGSEYAVNTWENKCRRITRSIQIFTCNMFGGNNINEGFDTVAKVLTDFFHHDGFLDVVPSDVVAGFILVRLEQRKERLASLQPSQQDVEVGSSLLPLHQQIDMVVRHDPNSAAMRSGIINISSESELNLSIDALEVLARCSTFSLAMYTHLIYLFMKPVTGTCTLCWGTLCAHPNDQRNRNFVSRALGRCTGCLTRCKNICTCSCSCSCYEHRQPAQRKLENVINETGRSVVVDGDNKCGLNRAGLSAITKQLENVELEYVSFKNDTSNKVFGVFLDHQKRQVVVAIRGTLSLEDCITDVLCEPVELSSVGQQFGFNGDNRYAHAGMLKSAMTIRAELEDTNVLENIFTNNSRGGGIEMPLNESSSCRDYELIITGHSLGAGSAVVLSLLLRGKYPNVKCFAFGTPGSVVDRRLAEECKPFVTSVVLGNDLVCRMSFVSLCKLRNDVLDAISRANTNKMQIMRALFTEVATEDLMYDKGKEPDSKFKAGVQVFKSMIADRIQAAGVPLCIPGSIIYMDKKLVESKCCGSKQRYSFRSADIDDFSEIYVSSSMAADHFPDKYYYDLHEELARRRMSMMTV